MNYKILIIIFAFFLVGCEQNKLNKIEIDKKTFDKYKNSGFALIYNKELKAKKGKPKINIQRFKGLGEMNPSQLRETVMDPASRQLVSLTISPNDNANSVMDLLLAKKRAPDRKEWLEKKGSLAKV